MSKILKYTFKLGVIIFSLSLILSFFFGHSLDNLQALLHDAKNTDLALKIIVISTLLIIDSFVSVPTLLITYTSGHLLSPIIAFLTCTLSFFTTFILLYLLSYKYGAKILKLIIRNEHERKVGSNYFVKNYFKVIVFSRFIPLLPEISFCLSGSLQIPLKKLILPFLLGTLPYTTLALFYGGNYGENEFSQGAIYFYISYILISLIIKQVYNSKLNSSS